MSRWFAEIDTIFYDFRSIFRNLSRVQSPRPRGAACSPSHLVFSAVEDRLDNYCRISATVNLYPGTQWIFTRTYTHKGWDIRTRRATYTRAPGHTCGDFALMAVVSRAAPAPGKFNWSVNDKNLSKPINRRGSHPRSLPNAYGTIYIYICCPRHTVHTNACACVVRIFRRLARHDLFGRGMRVYVNIYVRKLSGAHVRESDSTLHPTNLLNKPRGRARAVGRPRDRHSDFFTPNAALRTMFHY